MIAPIQPVAPPWFDIARDEVGVKEIPGQQANSRIVEYLRTTSLPANLSATDETAWCSAFVNWCLTQAGFIGTNRANARSWLTYGEPLTVPRLGCITVFSRDEAGPASGHVAFYMDDFVDAKGVGWIRVFGGNHDNKVGDKPYAKKRLLGYRWPKIAKITSP